MWLLAPVRLPWRVARRYHAERCAQTAAALSFATLLGLVPMIAIAAGLIGQLPFGSSMGTVLEQFLLSNLLPEKAGTIIAKYVAQFAHRAERVTLLGVGFLVLTALMQMLTIEHAFNAIWKVRKQRPWLHRLGMHVFALLLGPLVFGASLGATTYAASVSLGIVNEPYWLNTLVAKGMPFLTMSVLFGLLYWGVPNCMVVRWQAMLGGVAAAAGFVLLQKAFALYVTGLAGNAAIYGAFSAIPVFLVWLYLSWSVILIGALLVAEMPRSASP